jgi:hypothetical protein
MAKAQKSLRCLAERERRCGEAGTAVSDYHDSCQYVHMALYDDARRARVSIAIHDKTRFDRREQLA